LPNERTIIITTNQIRACNHYYSNSGVDNLLHACHIWHAKQFLMSRRNSMFYITILLWFTQKAHWPWLV